MLIFSRQKEMKLITFSGIFSFASRLASLSFVVFLPLLYKLEWVEMSACYNSCHVTLLLLLLLHKFGLAALIRCLSGVTKRVHFLIAVAGLHPRIPCDRIMTKWFTTVELEVARTTYTVRKSTQSTFRGYTQLKLGENEIQCNTFFVCFEGTI